MKPHDKKQSEKTKRSKSAPREMSTNKPGGGWDFLARSNLPKVFDPRFQDQCGEVDQIQFVKNYSFLQKNRETEIEQVKDQLRKTRNPEQIQKLKKKKQSLEDQFKTFESKQKDVEERFQWHNEERKRILEGKKPYWLSKSSMKEKQEQKKFQELKDSGRLNKYLIKRRKKLARKERLDFQ